MGGGASTKKPIQQPAQEEGGQQPNAQAIQGENTSNPLPELPVVPGASGDDSSVLNYSGTFEGQPVSISLDGEYLNIGDSVKIGYDSIDGFAKILGEGKDGFEIETEGEKVFHIGLPAEVLDEFEGLLFSKLGDDFGGAEEGEEVVHESEGGETLEQPLSDEKTPGEIIVQRIPEEVIEISEPSTPEHRLQQQEQQGRVQGGGDSDRSYQQIGGGEIDVSTLPLDRIGGSSGMTGSIDSPVQQYSGSDARDSDLGGIASSRSREYNYDATEEEDSIISSREQSARGSSKDPYSPHQSSGRRRMGRGDQFLRTNGSNAKLHTRSAHHSSRSREKARKLENPKHTSARETHVPLRLYDTKIRQPNTPHVGKSMKEEEERVTVAKVEKVSEVFIDATTSKAHLKCIIPLPDSSINQLKISYPSEEMSTEVKKISQYVPFKVLFYVPQKMEPQILLIFKYLKPPPASSGGTASGLTIERFFAERKRRVESEGAVVEKLKMNEVQLAGVLDRVVEFKFDLKFHYSVRHMVIFVTLTEGMVVFCQHLYDHKDPKVLKLMVDMLQTLKIEKKRK